MTAKRAFISLRGFGDHVVLVNFFNKYKKPGDIIFMRSGLLELHQSISTYSSDKIVSDYVISTPYIFNLRNGFFSLKEFFLLRQELIKLKNLGYNLVFDGLSNRHLLFGLGMIIKLPISNNIYQSYSTFFSTSVSLDKFESLPGTVLIFPFGSSPARSMSEEFLINIVNLLVFKSIKFKILLHSSEQKFISKTLFQSTFCYSYFSEVIEHIKFCSYIFTVDTVFLHLAEMYGVPTLCFTNSWCKFIPPRLLVNNCVLRLDDFAPLKNILNSR